jgi:hypothetical protein
MRFAHPSNTNGIALISGALTVTHSKLNWQIKLRSIRNCTTRWQSTHALTNSLPPFEGHGRNYAQVSLD